MQGHYPARIGLGPIWHGDVNNASLRRHFSVDVIKGLALFSTSARHVLLGGCPRSHQAAGTTPTVMSGNGPKGDMFGLITTTNRPLLGISAGGTDKLITDTKV
jgi:hypothetical protein